MMKLGTVVPCLFIILPSALKIYISKEKGWKLKVRKFWWLTPTFVEATREKLVRRLFVPVMSWSSRKKWKFIFSNVYSVPRKWIRIEKKIHTKAIAYVFRGGGSFGSCSSWEANDLPGGRQGFPGRPGSRGKLYRLTIKWT